MDSEICNSLLDIQDSQTILQTLVEKGLFISTVDNSSFHFQRLFQDFLIAQLNETPQNWKELHQKAADYFTRIGDYEEAIFHRISTGELSEAARLIALIGPKLLESGWLSTLSTWIEELSDHELEKKPDLYLLQGDAFRLCSNFENSIISYNNAEKVYLRLNDLPGRSRALRSKAQVYLDTIRPLKASSLLEEAIALLEPQEHPAEVADLLDQLAENKLNLGRPEEARELHNEAGLLRSESAPDDIYLEARSLLRTGRLIEGCALLENYGLENEKSNTNRPQRFHREMSLLQSLIYIMLGDIQKGEYFARQGIETGKQLDSPFVEAVGLMRLGHAYQLSPQVPWRKEHTQRSREYYERSIELVKPFNVVRVQVEPLWGLCRFHGYQGNIAEALRIARQAIEISETSGDNWFAALLRTTMGTAYVLAGEAAQAEAWLTQSIDGFVQVGDTFGQSTASCTRLLNYWMSGKKDKALSGLETIAPHLQHLNLNFLLTRPTHLGLQDTQAFLPFLVEAQNLTGIKEWVAQILEEQGLSGIDFHPGYGLDISCMGHFEVWRGKDLLSLRDWQRDKARQLFQFLVVGRGDWFAREQISEQLWPELDPVSSAQNLKAALNALNRAIEPKRESGKKPFFVIRRDNLYGLNPAAQIMVDTDDFFVLSSSDKEEDLLDALTIYQGEYLRESCDTNSIISTRERIHEAYNKAAYKLASMYFQQEHWDAAIKISHEILVQDSCNEPAFRILMKSHAARGNRSAVMSVYQRCCTALRNEMDVSPSRETTTLFNQLKQ